MRQRMRIIGLLLAAVLFAAATAGCGVSASLQGAAADSAARMQPDQGSPAEEAALSSSGQPSRAAPASALQNGKAAHPEDKGDDRPDGASAQPAIPDSAANASASGNSPAGEAGGSQPASQATASAPSGPASAVSSEASDNDVHLSIRGDGKKGAILDAPVKVSDGDTVLDVLKRATRENKIQMEFHGAGPTAYVEGIDNLYEFDEGAESGWMFLVNGVVSKSGAGAVKVKKGDRIEWRYTTNLGKDVNGNG